tara:strand:- start:7 stop:603 length:597 start_codon:yes stop_codon:yes gene_type:complete
MSSINSLSVGYKGGSKGSPAPQSIPQTRDKVLELLSPIKNYYIENNLMDSDILFIIDSIKCLKDNTTYGGDLKPSILTERICTFTKANYGDEKLTLNNLDQLIEGLDKILLNTTQNEKVVEVKKVVEFKNTLNPQTLSNGYKGGSPRIKSEGNLPKAEIEPIKIPIEDIVSKIRMWHADRNLSDEDINVIMEELIKIK